MDEATDEAILTGPPSCFDPEQIVKTVQIETRDMASTGDSGFRGLGRLRRLWYEYARYDTIFDEDAEEVTAEYTLNDDYTVVEPGVRPDGNPTFFRRRSCPGA